MTDEPENESDAPQFAPLQNPRLLEPRAVAGLTPFLETGEHILLANTVKVKSDSCMTAFVSVPDKFYSVALTEGRVLITPIAFLGGPSKNVQAYRYQDLSTVFQNRKRDVCLLTTKSKKKFAFQSGMGTGAGSEDFLHAFFTHFYDRASKVLVTPEFQGKDIAEALRFGAVTVVISE